METVLPDNLFDQHGDIVVDVSTAAAAAATAATTTSVALTEPVMMTATTAAAAVILQQNVVEAIISAINGNIESSCLTSSRVVCDDENIPASIDRLNLFRNELERSLLWHGGRSPGFFTMSGDEPGRTWSPAPRMDSYETMDFFPTDRFVVPTPSPASVFQCTEPLIRVFQERLAYTQQSIENNDTCACISTWSHNKHPLYTLVNQTLEQVMIEEASETVHRMLPSSRAWDDMYKPETCPRPVERLQYHRTPIKVLSDRDQYLSTLAKFCLKSESTIQISTCYLFFEDPAQRYVLLDLLPYVVKNHGVTVQILLDLMTMESAMVRSFFCPGGESSGVVAPPPFVPGKGEGSNTNAISALSFLEHLPADAPPMSDRAKAGVSSPLEFLNLIMEVAASCQDNGYRVHWWCARDQTHKYRIKNHSKSAVFDKQVAIMGGSNLAPTLASATSDLDILVSGNAAKEVADTFDILWEAMEKTEMTIVEEKKDDPPVLVGALEALVTEEFTDRSCDVAIVRSEPSSAGNDEIYRIILGAIAEAKESIIISMGHSNYPHAFSEALGEATKRGVRVQLLMNSMYSCDLRVNQRDLFLSVRDLLTIAPKVEVYTTALAHMKDADAPMNAPRPAFLHAKYVIIDHRWNAVGSWNVWTRSAFYEMEHEAFIESTEVAQQLEQKFERERDNFSIRLTSPKECEPEKGFCPKGCYICRPFGPFYCSEK